MTRIFTGDFSTGDLSQWPVMANKINTGPTDLYTGGYPVAVISEDKDCGYIARFEVRDGDLPAFGGGERSELFGDGVTEAVEGDVSWYGWSIKFDATFPNEHMTLYSDGFGTPKGWGVVGQWHGVPSNLYDPILSWGWGGNPAEAANDPGYFGLFQGPELSDNTPDPAIPFAARALCALPMNIGQWNDIKVQMKHSADPALGFVKVWYNSQPITMLGGSTTFTGQTLAPNADSQKVQIGYYRNGSIVGNTGIVSYANFRIADSEASL